MGIDGFVRRWWEELGQPWADDHRWPRLKPWWHFAVPVAVAAVGVGLALASGSVAGDCSEIHVAFSILGDADEIVTTVGTCSVSTGRLQVAYFLDIVAAVVYAIGLAAVLRVFWRLGWRSGSQGGGAFANAGVAVPVAAGLFDIAENAAALLAVSATTPTLEVNEWGARIGAGFGSAKWLLLVVTMFLVFLTWYGTARFGDITPEPRPGDIVDRHVEAEPRTVEHARALCLSGGGIRAAAFSWGALAALERHRRFDGFDHLYSVSGGGYAATAWTTSDRRLRDPTFYATAERTVDTPETVGPPPTRSMNDDVYQAVRRRRQFLQNGRGGVLGGVVLAIVFLSINLAVIFGGLVVVAIPVGLLARSRYGAFGPITQSLDDPSLTDGSWWPVTVLLAVAGVCLIVSLLATDAARSRLQIAAALMVGLALSVALVWNVLPWLAFELPSLFSTTSWTTLWAAVPAALAWVVSSLVAIVRPRVAAVAARLGGVLSTTAMFVGGLAVGRFVALSGVDGTLGWSSTRAWVLALAGVSGLLVLFDYSGIQWWSLHPLYRNRLAGTFAMHPSRGAIAPQPHDEWATWSELSARGEAGPAHVVCAATHRRERDVTGLTSVSLTFSRSGVSMHVPEVDDDTDTVVVTTYHRDAGWLAAATAPTPWSLLFRYRRDSVVTAAAVSGAAFNSAMGRLSQGSTDSLMAFLNLRLGLWLPNPRFDRAPGEGVATKRFTRPGLRYLFHEVIGHYDITDPFIHVSDGGHWENLGLVEALRARHRVVVCIDASGGVIEPAGGSDLPEGFDALYQAIDIARIELHTEVELDAGEIEAIRPDARTGRATQNWATGTIRYHSDPLHDWTACSVERCPAATLLYVRSIVCDRTPEWVLAFANTDRVFPNYPTSDQFLSDAEFRALVGLGESATDHALDQLGSEWWDG